MSRLATSALRAFMQAWRRLGGPMLTVIRPVDQWDLPDGYRVARAADALLDDAGRPIAPPDTAPYWTTDEVMALQVGSTGRELQIVPAGLVETGRGSYLVRASDLDTLRAAWGVKDSLGDLWHVTGLHEVAPGAVLRVELERR